MPNDNDNDNNKVNPATSPDAKPSKKDVNLDSPDRNEPQPTERQPMNQPDTGGQGYGPGDKGHMGLPREKERDSRG
jgi:hypothetical protein